MSIEADVERFILEELLLGNRRGKIDPDQPLIASGVVDSLGLIRLIGFLDEQYGVKVEDGELVADNFQTIALIKAFVEGKRLGPRDCQAGAKAAAGG